MAIAELAARQHGLVTRLQLLTLGLGQGAIAARLQSGRLFRVYPGVYAVGVPVVSYQAQAHAAVLACGPRAVLSHGSAATLWGIFTQWRVPYEVTAPTRHAHAGICARRSSTLAPEDRYEHHEIPVTSAARTVYDIAHRLTDSRRPRVIADMRRARFLYLPDLIALLDRHPRTRATRLLRPHVKHPERNPTRSRPEDRFVALTERYGLPEPRINTIVHGYEVDAYFPEHGLAVEIDSYEFHGGSDQFERDRERDATLLTHGITTIRITEERLDDHPGFEAERLRTILARCPHS